MVIHVRGRKLGMIKFSEQMLARKRFAQKLMDFALCGNPNEPIQGLPQDDGGWQPQGSLTFSGFQMAFSSPLVLHVESNSHPNTSFKHLYLGRASQSQIPVVALPTPHPRANH